MGSEEHILERFFAKKEYFADAVNGLLFQGKQIVRPEELEQISGNYKTFSVRGKAAAIAEALELEGVMWKRRQDGQFNVR